MRKAVIIASIAIAALSWGYFAFRVIQDAPGTWRNNLRESLASAGSQQPAEEHFILKPELDYDRLQSAIKSKPSLWRELVAPPPPAPPPPPAAPPPPNLSEMLKGVAVASGQMGLGETARVPIQVPGKGRAFYGVGDTINGLTIKSISRGEVVFSLVADGKEYTAVLRRP